MNDNYKPDDLSWHEYLKGYRKPRWRRPEDEAKYYETLGLLQPLYAIMIGNLLDKSSPKSVIAVPTPKPVQDRGHSPYTFKAQCSITGRLSRAIPYERYIEFGIFTEDAKTGGHFHRGPREITDRITPVIVDLEYRKEECRPIWDGPGLSWHDRYDQYLRSEEWLEKRAAVLKRDKYRCQWTGKATRPGDPLQVHHLTYERVGGERLNDLITVCRSAHTAHHAARKSAA